MTDELRNSPLDWIFYLWKCLPKRRTCKIQPRGLGENTGCLQSAPRPIPQERTKLAECKCGEPRRTHYPSQGRRDVVQPFGVDRAGRVRALDGPGEHVRAGVGAAEAEGGHAGVARVRAPIAQISGDARRVAFGGALRGWCWNPGVRLPTFLLFGAANGKYMSSPGDARPHYTGAGRPTPQAPKIVLAKPGIDALCANFRAKRKGDSSSMRCPIGPSESTTKITSQPVSQCVKGM